MTITNSIEVFAQNYHKHTGTTKSNHKQLAINNYNLCDDLLELVGKFVVIQRKHKKLKTSLKNIVDGIPDDLSVKSKLFMVRFKQDHPFNSLIRSYSFQSRDLNTNDLVVNVNAVLNTHKEVNYNTLIDILYQLSDTIHVVDDNSVNVRVIVEKYETSTPLITIDGFRRDINDELVNALQLP